MKIGNTIRINIIVVTVCIFLCCRFVESEKHRLTFEQMSYDKQSLFVFNVAITDPNQHLISNDTIGLFSSDIEARFNHGQKCCQWQFLSANDGKYKLVENKSCDVWEGILTCDTVLFIHPARNQYKALQFCPYPYFKANVPIGKHWYWEFKVGKVWAIDSVYPINANEPITISADYLLKDTLTVSTDVGRLFCYHIEAVSSSVYGHAYGSFYLNDRYGLVNFTCTTTQNRSYTFTLIKKLGGLDALKFNGYYAFLYKMHSQRNNLY